MTFWFWSVLRDQHKQGPKYNTIALIWKIHDHQVAPRKWYGWCYRIASAKYGLMLKQVIWKVVTDQSIWKANCTSGTCDVDFNISTYKCKSSEGNDVDAVRVIPRQIWFFCSLILYIQSTACRGCSNIIFQAWIRPIFSQFCRAMQRSGMGLSWRGIQSK